MKKNPNKNIHDFIDLDGYTLYEFSNIDNNLNNELNSGLNTNNVNIAIASAITAYARIAMTQVKNIPGLKLFYTDTDSAYTNAPLPSHLISDTKLGLFKLERICKDVVFLAPKVYGLLDMDNNQVIKVKGISKDALKSINFNTLDSLLNKDANIKLLQNKWFGSIVDGNISIKNQIYTLKATENKRQLIYFNNKLVNTIPFVIDKTSLILNSLNENSKLKI